MIRIMITTNPTIPLNDEDIVSYLKANPDFMRMHPELVDILSAPKADMGKGVADFQSFMIERLKEDKHKAIQVTRQVVENARSNMNNLARIQACVLKILEAKSFAEFIETITMDFSALLNVDITTLVVETSGRDIPHITAAGVRVVPEGTIMMLLNGEDAKLSSNCHGLESLYGSGAGLVRSEALVRVDISMNTPPAMLCFGSRDPDLFKAGQGTELIGFLARVVERVFRLWLDVPA